MNIVCRLSSFTWRFPLTSRLGLDCLIRWILLVGCLFVLCQIRAERISGVVLGTPIGSTLQFKFGGADVLVVDEEGRRTNMISSEQGAFEFRDLPRGVYRLQVSSPSTATVTVFPIILPTTMGSTFELAVLLPTTGILLGSRGMSTASTIVGVVALGSDTPWVAPRSASLGRLVLLARSQPGWDSIVCLWTSGVFTEQGLARMGGYFTRQTSPFLVRLIE